MPFDARAPFRISRRRKMTVMRKVQPTIDVGRDEQGPGAQQVGQRIAQTPGPHQAMVRGVVHQYQQRMLPRADPYHGQHVDGPAPEVLAKQHGRHDQRPFDRDSSNGLDRVQRGQGTQTLRGKVQSRGGESSIGCDRVSDISSPVFRPSRLGPASPASRTAFEHRSPPWCPGRGVAGGRSVLRSRRLPQRSSGHVQPPNEPRIAHRRVLRQSNVRWSAQAPFGDRDGTCARDRRHRSARLWSI